MVELKKTILILLKYYLTYGQKRKKNIFVSTPFHYKPTLFHAFLTIFLLKINVRT